MLLGGAAGIAVGMGRFALGGWLFLLSGILDTFDGRLARSRNTVTPAGAAFDSLLDRYADGAMLIGLAFYFRASWVLIPTLAAIFGTSMVPYVRAKAESFGVTMRDGLMQRPERVLTLGVAVAFSPWVEGLWPAGGRAPDAAARGGQPRDPGDHQQHDGDRPDRAAAGGAAPGDAGADAGRGDDGRQVAACARAPAAGQNLTRTPTTVWSARSCGPVLKAVTAAPTETSSKIGANTPNPLAPQTFTDFTSSGSFRRNEVRRRRLRRHDLPEVERRERGGERPAAAGRRIPRDRGSA